MGDGWRHDPARTGFVREAETANVSAGKTDVKRLTAVLGEVAEERARQDDKWGPPEERQHLTLSDLVVILTEEVGELSEAVLERQFAGSQSSEKGYDPRQEAIQVAAVATAIVEHLDLRDWADPATEREQAEKGWQVERLYRKEGEDG